MKVLHIGKYYPPYFGGIEKVNFDLVEGLNKNNIQTDVLCFNHLPGNSVEEKNYKINRASVFATMASTPLSFSFFKILKKTHREYDIIHLHMPNPIAGMALQSLNFKGKIVLHWHLDIVKQKSLKFFYKPLQEMLLKKADAIIVTSPEYLEHSPDLKKHKQKCHVIPIGIDNAYLSENIPFRKKLQRQYKGKKIIFSIGRLIYYKGFEYLIEAAKHLDEDTMVLIGGKGKLENQLKNLIAKENLEQKVKLLGKIDQKELGEYYRLADVFCLPSVERSEAFGIVLVEAMSLGCPLVSTKMGSGTSWVNQDGSTGLVVPPKNPELLALAIKKIIDNEKMKTNYAKNSFERYEKEFRLDLMIDRTLKLYQSLQ